MRVRIFTVLHARDRLFFLQAREIYMNAFEGVVSKGHDYLFLLDML